jgi:colanic acid biosynthesis glycosyl transferase WcaI
MGHEVSILCALPHYPSGQVEEKYRGHFIMREVRDGVDVTRVWVPSVNRARLGQRLCSVIVYQLLAAAVGLGRRFDVLLTVNPAFELALPILFLGILRRKPFLFSVWDIYPDVGVKLGIFRWRPIIKAVDGMENLCYRHAACIQVLSTGHRASLEARGVPRSKLAVVGPWVDTEFIRPSSRKNEFSTQHNLDHSFVVMYAGNFGLTHGLELLMETASFMAVEQSIRFVLVGDGAARAELEETSQKEGLTNVQFIASQPRERAPLFLAAADISLVMLRRGFGMDSVPSKCYSILASGRPMIAVVDRGCDTWKLVERAACGLCVEPGDPGALASAILKLYRDKGLRDQLGANGRAYALKHHSRVHASKEFYRLFSIFSEKDQTLWQENVIGG